MTRREIAFSIIKLATRFSYNDESRLDPDYIGYLVDQTRAQLIRAEYKRTGIVDPRWLSQLGVLTPTKVNIADDKTITGCKCDMYKITLPPTIAIKDSHSGTDVGIFSMMSECGTKEYFYYPIRLQKNLTEDHPRYGMNYYAQVGNACYLNKPGKIRPLVILENPLDAKTINSEIIPSGSLSVGTSYTVINAQVVHNSLGYGIGKTFTAVNANYTGNGQVVPTTEIAAADDEDPYPVGADLARMITLEILQKEFQIEKSAVEDDTNNSKDESTQK